MLKGFVRGIMGALLKVANWASTEGKAPAEETIYERQKGEPASEEVHSIWDYLEFAENSQAFHLVGVVGFEEWVDMAEIKRRIAEIYKIEYKNDRSLYPYIKTLTDAGLFETTSAGGRRKWRKRDLVIKLKGSIKKEALVRQAEKAQRRE
ncbi:MAG: hypothetical protein V1676_04860 [Candidatus Diapherotrites archaeon]